MKNTTNITTAETDSTPFDTEWTRARQIMQGIKRHTAHALAGQIALGFELQRLRKSLEYRHGGDRKSKPQAADLISGPRTWAEWCRQMLGISDDSARRFMLMADAIKPRLRKIGGPVSMMILQDSDQRLSDLDTEALYDLVAKCTDADTQAGFLREIGMAKNPHKLEGGHQPGTHGATPPDPVQLMLSMWVEPVALFVDAFARKDAEESLWRLPLSEPDGEIPSLTQIEGALDRELKRVRDIRKKRQQGHTLDIDV